MYLIFLIIFIHYSNQEVIKLTDKNFKPKITFWKHSLVMFYAPWCDHCSEVLIEFDNLENYLYSNIYEFIHLAKMDCTDELNTCMNETILMYPTLKYYRYGKFYDEFFGIHNAKDISKFARLRSGSLSKQISSKDFDSFLKDKNEVHIVALLHREGVLKEHFFNLTRHFNAKYAHAFINPVLRANELIMLQRPKILENKYEGNIETYNGDGDDLYDFAKNAIHGLVGHRHKDNVNDFKLPLITAYYDIDYGNPDANFWREQLLRVAAFYKKYTFAVSNLNDFQSDLDRFGSRQEPVVCIHGFYGDVYLMETDFGIDNLVKFVRDFDHGKLEQFVRSQDIPAVNNQPVKIVVAKNFNKMVIDNFIDVLLQFYSPKCNYCIELEPIYDELAEKLIGRDVMVAKMDITRNEIPLMFVVKRVPKIYFLSKNNKYKPKHYMGARTVEDLLQFVDKHSSDSLTVDTNIIHDL